MKGILRRLGGALSVLWCSLLAAVAVAESPAVQMLVPGFEVRELPIELTNINSLKYRRDGKLYALAYSGDIWLLSDTDGDQLEDRKELFFESRGRLRGPIGMAVIPPEHPLLTAATGGEGMASGVVVASKGKVSAILDTDGDGVADTERIIASGWKEIPQNVDAVGVAIDSSDGAIYFGLGTAAYNNAYLLDEAGVSHFDLSSERGTIQRIEPDLSSRSTLCTGVRFTIGMAFNADERFAGIPVASAAADARRFSPAGAAAAGSQRSQRCAEGFGSAFQHRQRSHARYQATATSVGCRSKRSWSG